MDDKDKSAIGKLVDTVTSAVGGVVKAAIMPTHDDEAVAEKANEQMLHGDAAIAPEAIPAPTTRKKSAKQKAPPAKAPAKKSKRTSPIKSAKKPLRKAAKKARRVKKARKVKKKSTR
jgi:hypothetical protein